MDKKIANPDMLMLARESRGFTQTELARRLHITQAAISKAEKLQGKATESLISALAGELDYPETFFYQTGGRFEPLSVLHRKQSSLPQKLRHKIEANACVTLQHIHHLLDSVEVPEWNMTSYSAEDFDDGIEGVARAVRATARLPAGPLPSISILLERMGVILVARDFGSEKLDAFTMMGRDCPVIFFNQTMPWCRIRFSLAHELGHLVLGHIPGKHGIEEAANAFASALLMPKCDISRVFNGEKINIAFLAALKPYWKVSMQALMRRALDLGFLLRPTYEYLCKQMTIKGYRKREPASLDIPAETPGMLRDIILLHLNNLGYSKAELCEMLCSNQGPFEELYPDFAPPKPRNSLYRIK